MGTVVRFVRGAVPDPPPALVFQSRWETATGTSLSAVTDGGAWDDTFIGNYTAVLEVVTPASVGWTGAGNVLRVRQRGPTNASKPRVVNVVPESTTHWGRFYFRNDETATLHSHPVSYAVGGSDGGIVIVPWLRQGQASSMLLGFPTGAAFPNAQFFAGAGGGVGLPNGTWYRYEWQVEYVTASTIRLWPRVYSMAGTLLHDASSYTQSGFPFTGTLADWNGAGNTISIASTAAARIFSIGNEGPAASTDNDESWYHADLALSTQGWIGA